MVNVEATVFSLLLRLGLDLETSRFAFTLGC